MPPNRKGSPNLVDDLARLNVASFVTTSKYQPLTHESPSNAPVTKAPVVTKQVAAVNAQTESYWDWPAFEKDAVKVLTEEERIQKLFSVNHIEANLIAAGESLAAAMSLKEPVVASREVDDYWYAPSDDQVKMEDYGYGYDDEVDYSLALAQHKKDVLEKYRVITPTNESPVDEAAAYWDWPAFSEKEHIQRIFQETERVRMLFSVDHIQEQLVDQYTQVDTRPKMVPISVASDAYWVF
jgi:hypothetical protein